MLALSERSIAFTRVHAIASSSSSWDNYKKISSYGTKKTQRGALTFSGDGTAAECPLPPVFTDLPGASNPRTNKIHEAWHMLQYSFLAARSARDEANRTNYEYEHAVYQTAQFRCIPVTSICENLCNNLNKVESNVFCILKISKITS
jgi:hypothetical protein